MRRITMLALAAVLVLLGAACGGDDDSSDEDAATSDGGSTTDDGGNDDGSDGASDDVDPTGLLDEDCQFLLAGAFLNPMAAAQTGDDDFEQSAEQLEQIADNAPDEIQDAMAVLADRFAEIAELFQDIDFSDPSSFQDPDTQAAIEDLEEIADEEYQQAGEEVSTWLAENCSGTSAN